MGALMSSLVQWARRSSSLGRLCSITANRRRPDSVMSGPSLGVGGGNGATNSFCSYLALIHDSRSSLDMQESREMISGIHLQFLVFLLLAPISLDKAFVCSSSCKAVLSRESCYISLDVCLYRVASGEGLRRPSVRASHILLTMWLPMALRTSVSSRGKSSRSRERTRDRWVPKFLWIPEHSMHMRAPRFRLAQVGSWEREGKHKSLGGHFILNYIHNYISKTKNAPLLDFATQFGLNEFTCSQHFLVH